MQHLAVGRISAAPSAITTMNLIKAINDYTFGGWRLRLSTLRNAKYALQTNRIQSFIIAATIIGERLRSPCSRYLNPLTQYFNRWRRLVVALRAISQTQQRAMPLLKRANNTQFAADRINSGSTERALISLLIVIRPCQAIICKQGLQGIGAYCCTRGIATNQLCAPVSIFCCIDGTPKCGQCFA